MVIYLAGLQTIPPEYYEAARIDGAFAWQRFRSITLPLLSNTTMFVTIIALIASFQAFDQIFVMTQGGPAFSTETLVMLIYRQGLAVRTRGRHQPPALLRPRKRRDHRIPARRERGPALHGYYVADSSPERLKARRRVADKGESLAPVIHAGYED